MVRDHPAPGVVGKPEHHHDPSIRPRAEGELSESGVGWDERRREWVADDELPSPSARDQGSERTIAPANVDSEKQVEVIWVEWDGTHDPENPYHFASAKKWRIAWISSLFTLAVAWTGSSFPVGNKSLMAELNCSRELAVMGLSAFPLGFGIAPLFLAPVSEETGRYAMYVYSSLVYVLFVMGTALSKNITSVIMTRFISGLAASTGSTLVGGTVADLFESSNRGPAMSLFSVCAFAGTGLGPAVLGYVGEKLSWRWIQYIQIMMGGAICLAIIFLTQETRGSVILSRRAKKLRKANPGVNYQSRSDIERDSLLALVKVSLTRPIYLLCTEAIVAAFSASHSLSLSLAAADVKSFSPKLWVGLSWGVLYLCLECVALVMSQVYGFSDGESGLVFFAVVVASALGFLTNVYQEKLYQKHVHVRGPEARLYGACVGGLVFPAGLFIFAFAQGRGHWMGPVVGLVLTFTGIFSIYLATFNYLADCYTIYASSALSGQSLIRNLAGCVFPLFTFQMYTTLGFQWASFLAGCLALALSVTPFVLLAWGPRIRAASKFAKELERMKG